MDTTERTKLKQKILETITKTEEELVRLEEASQPISPENSIGRVSRMDAINNKSVSEAALRSAKKKLSSLQTALSRIDSPDFGNCARCRKPIPAARLMYLPESKFCVQCADKR